jgi:hypothetical protein
VKIVIDHDKRVAFRLEDVAAYQKARELLAEERYGPEERESLEDIFKLETFEWSMLRDDQLTDFEWSYVDIREDGDCASCISSGGRCHFTVAWPPTDETNLGAGDPVIYKFGEKTGMVEGINTGEQDPIDPDYQKWIDNKEAQYAKRKIRS